MNVIETNKLTKHYGKNRGITNVSLSVKEGDFYGFIGPNGAGKSTTIRTLLGLISPSSGNALIFGKDIKAYRTEILSGIGYLPSEISFYRGMKVKDVISLSASIRKKDCSNEAKKLCERLDLDPSKKVEELSFGNRKKVGIVCAFQHNPKLYIFDEPTSGLDPLIQKEFYSILKEKNESGSTVFLSSHVLWEIEKYCKNASIIKEGKIIASDSVDKLSYTGMKKVSLKGVNDSFNIRNAKNLSIQNNVANFLFQGNAKELLKELTEFEFKDITISDPTLDEVFMHFYERGTNE